MNDATEEQRQVNKNLVDLKESLVEIRTMFGHQKERVDGHEGRIEFLQSRITTLADRLSELITMFELLRFVACKDCPLSETIERSQKRLSKEGQ